MVGLGTGEVVSGGLYVNIWSGIGTNLENNQAVTALVGKISQQVNINTGNLGTWWLKSVT
jgi:hypothetical protein